MILAVDVGNTNITFGGIGENKKIQFMSRLYTDVDKSEDEYAVEFSSILSLYNIDTNKISGSIISSVVPQLITVHKKAIKKITGKDPLIVDSSMDLGLKIEMGRDVEIGSDLIVGAIASIEEYGEPLIVFDLGTATTVSVIDSRRSFIGGLIFPGVKVSLDELSRRASKLPYIDLENASSVIGKNSVESMNSGILHGTAAMIDGIIQRIREETKEDHKVIITGGFSKVISPYCKEDVICDDDLLIKGLLIIYERVNGFLAV